MARPFQPLERPNANAGALVNEAITAQKVRLIDGAGENRGVVTRQEALAIANAEGMDLVLMGNQSSPPVAKILDYGKHRYELQKKRQMARKNQKTINLKEIKMRPRIDEHDYGVKVRAIRKFIEDGDKVKITLRLRGREIANKGMGLELLRRVTDDVEDIAKKEKEPVAEGRQVIMVLARR